MTTARIEDFRGRAIPNVMDWGDLDLNYKVIARIDRDLCIGCQLCYVACEDGAHQAIERAARQPAAAKKILTGWRSMFRRIIDEECVGCNLCALVCPVDRCITMVQVDTGLPPMSWKQRTCQAALDPSAEIARGIVDLVKPAQIRRMRQFDLQPCSVIVQFELYQLGHGPRPADDQPPSEESSPGQINFAALQDPRPSGCTSAGRNRIRHSRFDIERDVSPAEKHQNQIRFLLLSWSEKYSKRAESCRLF